VVVGWEQSSFALGESTKWDLVHSESRASALDVSSRCVAVGTRSYLHPISRLQFILSPQVCTIAVRARVRAFLASTLRATGVLCHVVECRGNMCNGCSINVQKGYQ
jgi:hypothetical protein